MAARSREPSFCPRACPCWERVPWACHLQIQPCFPVFKMTQAWLKERASKKDGGYVLSLWLMLNRKPLQSSTYEKLGGQVGELILLGL